MYRKGSYIAARIIGLAAVLVLGALFAIQTPSVQTRLSRYAMDRLTAAADGRILYDEIKVIPSGALVIKNILILDKNPYTEDVNVRGWAPADTILKARTLTATFSLPSLIRPGSIRVGRVRVDGGEFHLTVEPNSIPGGKKNITNIERAFGLGGKKKKDAPKGELFSVKRVSVSNFRFRLNSFKPQKVKYKEGAINFDDIDAHISSLSGHGVKMVDGRVTATLDRLRLTEKSGYTMLNLSAICSVGPGKTTVEDIRLRDPWSEINLKYYSMSYANARSFSKYVREVMMEGVISRSRLTLHSLSFFANSAMRNYSTQLDLRGGKVKGYVNDLKVEGLCFSDPESGIRLDKLDCSLTGLPDVKGMMASADLTGLHFTVPGIRKLSAGMIHPGVKIPSDIGKGQHFTLNASAKGPLSRLKGTVHLRSEAGRVKLEADVRNLPDPRRDTELRLRLGTAGLDISAVSGVKGLGKCDIYTEARATLTGGIPDISLDSLKLNRLNAAGYDYKNITAKGSLTEQAASLTLDSADPNLMMTLRADAALGSGGGEKSLRLDADIDNLDLNALGIDRKRSTSRTAMGIHGAVRQTGKALNGALQIGGIRLWNGNGQTDLGDIDIKVYNIAEEQCLSLDSQFADLFVSGSGSITEFLEDLQDITTRRELPALYPDVKENIRHGKYDLDLLMHDSRGLLSFVFPGLYIADSTRATMSISRSGELVGNATSPRLAFGTTFLKDADLQFDNLGESLSISLIGQNFKSGKFDLNRPDISILARDNTMSASMRFESFSLSGGSGELYANGEFYRDSTNTLVIKAHPLESYISAGKGVWDINESDVVVRDGDIYVKDFRISNGRQVVSLDGGISKERDDTLSLRISRLDLAQVDDFLPRSYGISGVANGRAMLTSRAGRAKGMLMDFRLDSLKIGDADAGNLQIASILEDNRDDLNIYLRNELDGRNPLYATGMYFLDDGRMYLDAELDRLPLGTAGPFLSEIFSEIDGSVSGNLRLSGMRGSLSFSSRDLTLNDAMLKPAYTGVSYTVSGPLEVADDGIHLNALQLRDNDGGSGIISGSINRDRLRSDISFSRLKLMDSQENGTGVYGSLRASGNATVEGPFTALSVNATVSTTGDGNIHVPMSGAAANKSSDLLTFTQRTREKDPYEEMLSTMDSRKRKKSDIDINANLTVHSGVKAFIELDKSASNVASLSGDGNVNLHFRPAKAVFDLNGDFSIREGNYQFVLPGILSKDFSVAEGSSIKFGGDIADTELDINVIYKQKASLSALVSEESKTGTKRLVECGMSVTDRLRNPKIGFSVEVPDLDPTTKSLVEAALSTEDKVQKQFMALLLMGSFIPDESSGVVNGSEILVSNVTELMSNQLNSILQKLEIPIDVGIGYQGTYQGSNMFDVAISTQLFNDRVIVGGSVANRKYNNTASSGDMVGDLDIQIKLDDEGRFRLNIFSHSADEYTSYLDLSQRNGVGVSYQKEYLGFGDFLGSIFGSRKVRASEGGAGTTIKIETDEQRKTVSDTLTVGK